MVLELDVCASPHQHSLALTARLELHPLAAVDTVDPGPTVETDIFIYNTTESPANTVSLYNNTLLSLKSKSGLTSSKNKWSPHVHELQSNAGNNSRSLSFLISSLHTSYSLGNAFLSFLVNRVYFSLTLSVKSCSWGRGSISLLQILFTICSSTSLTAFTYSPFFFCDVTSFLLLYQISVRTSPSTVVICVCGYTHGHANRAFVFFKILNFSGTLLCPKPFRVSVLFFSFSTCFCVADVNHDLG